MTRPPRGVSLTHSTKRRTFAQEVDSHLNLYAAHYDALMQPQAMRVVATVLLNAIVVRNNQLGAGNEPPELNELLPDDIEVYSGVMDIADRLARVADRADPSGARRPWMARTVARVVAGRFENARCRGFLDTDEIRGLVAVAYGVGLHVRREHPGLAETWVLGAAADE